MSVSVQEIGRLNNGTRLPVSEYESEDEEAGAGSSSLFLPFSLLWEQATGGIVKLVHFSFTGGSLHEILGQADIHLESEDTEADRLVLNARIISATFSRARKAAAATVVPFPETVEVVLGHVDQVGVSADFPPACVVWNTELSLWSDAGCSMVATNATHTTCRCTRLGPYSLASRAELRGAAGHQVAGGVAAGNSGGISVVTLQIVTYIVAAISVLCVVLILLKVCSTY